MVLTVCECVAVLALCVSCCGCAGLVCVLLRLCWPCVWYVGAGRMKMLTGQCG